ncbi:unnamed protein product [Pylaiella littoralis]
MDNKRARMARESSAMTNMDILASLLQFVPDKRFLFFASVSRSWRKAWGKRGTLTAHVSPDSSVAQLQFSFEIGLPRCRQKLCASIAGFDKLELLQCAREHGFP